MARITVEDCVERVPSRFELVMLAAQRARDVSAGSALTLERDNDKNPVVALREIAEATVELDHLRYELIHGLRRHVDDDDEPDDLAQELEALMPSHMSGMVGGQAAGESGEEEMLEGMSYDDLDVTEDED